MSLTTREEEKEMMRMTGNEETSEATTWAGTATAAVALMEGGQEEKEKSKPKALLGLFFLVAALALALALASGAQDAGAQQAASSGKVLAWGYNEAYGVTNVPADAQSRVKAITARSFHSLALKEDGKVVAWGQNFNGQSTVPAGALSGVKDIAAGTHHSLALKEDGSIVGWGWAPYLSFPTGTQSGVKDISAGNHFSLAIKADGSVVGWGDNTYGQITVPAGAQSGVKAIEAGGYHSLALKEDGSVEAWGANDYGQINVPDEAKSGVKAIAAGGYGHNLALKEDGSVVAWGASGYGQTTVPDEAKSGVKAIAAGNDHSLALKEDGSVVAWGSNDYGERNVPTGLKEAEAIAAGGRHTLAIDAPTPPGSVEYFDADAGDGRVSLSWSNPSDADLEAVRVLRSETAPATGPEPDASQTQVFEGKDESFEDTNLTNAKTYYYTAYAKDNARLWSERASVRATPTDATAPEVEQTDPAGGQRGVARDAVVKATFSEELDEASVEAAGVFTLKKQGASGPVDATVSYAPDTKTLTLDPASRLGKGATYTATITTQAQDEAGNALAEQKVWTFKTKRK